MITAELLIKHAAHERPLLMQKTAEVVESLDKETQRAVLQEMKDTAKYVAEKIAAGPMGMYGAALGGHILSGVAGNLAGDLYDAAKRGITRQRNLNRILQDNADVRLLYKQDKTRVNQVFDAMHRFAPEITSDPLVGGTLLKSMVEVPGNEAVILKDLIGTEKNVHDRKKLPFGGPTIDLTPSTILDKEKREKAEHAMRAEKHKADMDALGKETAKDRLEREKFEYGKKKDDRDTKREGAKVMLQAAIRDRNENTTRPSPREVVKAWKAYRKLSK